MRAILFALAVVAAPAAAAAQPMTPAQVTALPSSQPYIRASYGNGPIQVGELRLPPGKGPFPVAVIIHGGCWKQGFATMAMTSPMATALTARGFATWNIEYRQLGQEGGGWPGTFQDWGEAVDHLRWLAKTEHLDLSRVIAVGHSAGGHAAQWLAARPGLPKDSPLRGEDPIAIKAAVDIDGPPDLRPYVGSVKDICGAPVISDLMGGEPAAQPDRYKQGNPAERLPLHTTQLLVSAKLLTPDAAKAYAAAARAAGDRVEILELPDTGHHEPVAPGTPAWAKVEAFIVEQALK
jgi:acetyl esterase/lipase